MSSLASQRLRKKGKFKSSLIWISFVVVNLSLVSCIYYFPLSCVVLLKETIGLPYHILPYLPNQTMKYQSIDFVLFDTYLLTGAGNFFWNEKWWDLENGKIWTVVSWESVSIVLPWGENKIGSWANRVGEGGQGEGEGEEKEKRENEKLIDRLDWFL